MAVDFNYHGVVAVFDLDDTLLRERDFCRGGFTLIEEQLKSISPGDRFEGVAAELTALLEQRLPWLPALDRRLAPDLSGIREQLLDAYGSHTVPATPPAKGAIETLQSLAADGVVMAIVTDGRSITQRAKIRSAGLERFFRPELIYISEERGADKSRPDSFTDIVRHFPEARKFIYIADNPAKDFRIPSLLGWDTACVAYNDDNVHKRDDNAIQTEEITYNNIGIGDISEIIAKSNCHNS